MSKRNQPDETVEAVAVASSSVDADVKTTHSPKRKKERTKRRTSNKGNGACHNGGRR